MKKDKRFLTLALGLMFLVGCQQLSADLGTPTAPSLAPIDMRDERGGATSTPAIEVDGNPTPTAVPGRTDGVAEVDSQNSKPTATIPAPTPDGSDDAATNVDGASNSIGVQDSTIPGAEGSEAPSHETFAAAGGETRLPPADAVRISEAQDYDAWSSTSPDGKWIAEGSMKTGISFGDREHYYAQLKATSTDGSAAYLLFEILSPFGLGYTIPDPLAWSSDGRSLYFTVRPVVDGCGLFVNGGDLYQANLVDGSVSLVLANAARALAVSPDGSRVAYVPWGAPPELVIHKVETGQEQRTTLQGNAAGAILWSPDGAHIVLTVAREACMPGWSHEIVQVETATLTQTTLVPSDKRRFITQEWIEDGCVQLSDNEGALWWLEVETGELTQKK